MATRYLERFSSLSFIDSLPSAAGIGVVGGMAYLNVGGGAVPLNGPLRIGGASRLVSAALSTTVNDVHATVQAAIDAASAGDDILIAPGDYDEAVTITKRLRLLGLGGDGAVAIAPSAADGIAVTVDGTTGVRVAGVELHNIGAGGNGAGGGLHVKGDIRRLRVYGGKYEADTTGAFGIKLESTAAGSVGDTRIIGAEFAWTVAGLHLLASGGGDPVSQTLVAGCLLHNFSADGIKTSGAHAIDLWIRKNLFANQENATEPTRYLDIDDAGTTGAVVENEFMTTLFAAAKMAIAAGVLWVDNKVEAELPGLAAYGTNGRPD